MAAKHTWIQRFPVFPKPPDGSRFRFVGVWGQEVMKILMWGTPTHSRANGGLSLRD